MPGYVFVAGEHFSAFTRHLDAADVVPHCIGWLSGPNGPEPVQPPVVEDIKRREQKGEFDSSERIGKYWAPRWLKPRTRVRINAGVFTGMCGEVWRITGARVAIWVQMLGGPSLTECPIEACPAPDNGLRLESRLPYPRRRAPTVGIHLGESMRRPAFDPVLSLGEPRYGFGRRADAEIFRL
jgi:hypothetical protein